ncbi:arylsulfatase B-like [Zootermopsis nevadensis]|uniref:Arylsulfatase B n=1 Tax=Zootermopsis nevadensis TaxID=136037 RepID=A0A067QYG0_ZOONE|nr:arylsulfatase B-like [Zootermopsis nevadensis]XP_021929308.1 arylsulfatase B-like [Zootermopsis nevadensis]KDR14503.1 Arylsulfatase B [Zootermopsis nevadensis]
MFTRWWCALLLFSSVLATNQTRPHIIFILADDLGWNDVGFHGSDQVPTPNIDALAYSGVILNNYYVLPVCSPSRSALMTGRHPIHTGMQHSVIFANEPWGLPLEEKLLPEYLQELSYVNRMVGKWHLGHFRANYTPLHRGFESHYGYWGGHQDYYDHTAQDSLRYWGYDMRRGMEVHWESYGYYTTDLFSREAVRTIMHHDKARSLFLYLAHLATHSANPYRPLQAPAETVNKFSYIADKQRRTFAGMLSKLDQCVGDVVAALGERGMLNNSIIIFSTDNGGPAAGFNLNAASNWPLRGVKDTLWEGGVRGVGLVWSPLIPEAPRVANHLMHIQDWLPSLLHAVNASVPSHLDGHDVWTNILSESSSSYDQLLLNIDNERGIAALRKGDFKLVKGRTWDGQWDGWYGPSGRKPAYRYNVTLVYDSPAGRAIAKTSSPLPSNPDDVLRLRAAASVSCDSDIKPTCAGPSPVCLFNVRRDPCELDNLSDKYPLLVVALQELLDQYNATVVKPLNKTADPRSNPKYWNYTWTNWMDKI